MKSSVRAIGLAAALAALAAVAPATASAAPTVGDYSCDFDLSVQTEVYNNSSGPFTAAGTAECWVDDPTQRVPAQLSASGTYTAQKCSLLSVAQPSYLTLRGSLTITPAAGSGWPSGTTGMTITTADVANVDTSAGTIALDSGQSGPVTVQYDKPVLGTIQRCGGGNRFRPQYSGTFLAH